MATGWNYPDGVNGSEDYFNPSEDELENLDAPDYDGQYGDAYDWYAEEGEDFLRRAIGMP